MVRIGINPLTWTNDDLPELGEANSLETCLKEAKLAGYEGVELGRKFPRDAKVLGPILKPHGLNLVSGWYSARLLERSVEDEIKAMQSHAALLKALGAKVMVFCEVSRCVHGERKIPLSRRPKLAQKEWKQFGERLDAVAAELDKQGLKMAYHHHMGTVIQSEDEVDRMMGSTKSVGLLLDSGHLTFAGGDPMRALKRHAKRIVHVHCKDIRKDKLAAARKQDMSFLDAVLGDVFAVPGDGSIDFDPLLAELATHHYEGWLVVEADQDPAKAHPLTHARIGHDCLRPLAQRYWTK
ncbi:MAG TPA: myo-inosose-2 dehydratase [Burkholderiales bacterium]|jgi:inosose dehydratase|nr:myo-inosose-2 dehydratase [Burkholderiales bacterium]